MAHSDDCSSADDAELVRLTELLDAAKQAFAAGEHAAGCGDARAAVALADELAVKPLQGEAYFLLGSHLFRLGDYESSLAALHRALGYFGDLSDLTSQSAALNGMVLAYHELGLQDEALEHAGRTLEVAKASGDPLTIAWAYNRAGLGHAAVGNIVEGIESMEFALKLARELDDPEAIFAALNNLIEDLTAFARELFESGDEAAGQVRLARGLELAEEALARARKFENPYEEAIILLTYGQALVLDKQRQRAHAVLDECEAMSLRGGYRSLLLGARYERARLEVERGDLREAISHFIEVLHAADEIRDARVLIDVHMGLWQAYKGLGEFREALEHCERVRELERDQQSDMARTRARMLSTHLDLDRVQREADRATLEVERERTRTRELEAQALQLREERELLSRRADQDGLTGLWNRRYVEHELPQMVREAAARGEPVSVAFVDADHFKSVNDRFGHLVGDDVLRRVADVLRANVRPTDVVARFGGEEFVVLLPGASVRDAELLGERLCEAVRSTAWSDLTEERMLTVSIGVATRPPLPVSGRALEREVAELLGRADRALYEAKRGGRDRVHLAAA